MSKMVWTVEEEGGAPIQIQEDLPGGAKRVGYVTPQQAAAFLLGQRAAQGDTGRWVDLLSSFGVAIMTSGEVSAFLIAQPPQERSFNYGRNGVLDSYKRMTVTTPPLLWGFKWNGERCVGYRLWISDRTVMSLQDTARIQSWPFGHSNQRTGIICWGSADISHLRATNPLEGISLFFGSGLNEHLFYATYLPAGGRGGLATSLQVWYDGEVAKGNKAPALPVLWERHAATGWTPAISNLQTCVGWLGGTRDDY